MPQDEIEVDFPYLKSDRLKAKVLFWQPCDDFSSPQENDDVAVLELPPNSLQPVQRLKLHPITEPWGHPFRVVGFPKGCEELGDWAKGTFLDYQSQDWLQLDTEIPVEKGYRSYALTKVKKTGHAKVTSAAWSRIN